MFVQGTPDIEHIQSFFFHWGDRPLMQFTGLKGNNGKEIYEGDIVMLGTTSGSLVGDVYWNDDHGWQVRNDIRRSLAISIGAYDEHVEVIGNIHENPELL